MPLVFNRNILLVSLIEVANVFLSFSSAFGILDYYAVLSGYPQTEPLRNLIAPWPYLSFFLVGWGVLEVAVTVFLCLKRTSTLVNTVISVNALNIGVVIASYMITAFSASLFTRLLTLKLFISILAAAFAYAKRDWIIT